MNRIVIDGRLTKDPETRATASGKEVCTFSLASDKNGAKQDDSPNYFNCTAFGKTGERVQKWLSKGRRITVFGSVSLREYETKAGKHGASLDVLVDDFWFGEGKKSENKTDGKNGTDANWDGYKDLSSEDIPF